MQIRSMVGVVACVAALAAAAPVRAQESLSPPAAYPDSADPGQCFARVRMPEQVETLVERVLEQPARTETKRVPATYALVDQQVLLKEGRTEFRTIPATYRTVTETVVVSPQRTETIVLPAAVETYEERALVRPAYVTWKPGGAAFGRPNPAETMISPTGEVLCRVEMPAEYRTVTRTRLVTPESTAEKIIPARTQVVSRQVLDQPARVVEVAIPPEYGTVKVRTLISPARDEVVEIPAVYRTVHRREVRAPARLEWREVLCETNASPAKIRQIQTALTARGFAVPATGHFGPKTLAAMEGFQRARGLTVGLLTIDTVRALGVSPR